MAAQTVQEQFLTAVLLQLVRRHCFGLYKQFKMESPSKQETPTEQLPTIHLFESQTKRLKSFFRQHRKDLLGCRLIFAGSIATVRFVGGLVHEGKPAGSDQELWIGVEWDEVNRGKHNGTVGGHCYFTCPEQQGSLLKFDKVQFGYKLETGYFKRYFRTEEIYHAKSLYDQMQKIKASSQTEEQKKKQRDELGRRKHTSQYHKQAYVETLRKNKVMVEFIGFDEIWNKLHNLDSLENICLASSQICDLGGKGELSRIFPNLHTLSFEDNLLYDWNQIYLIGSELERLRELSITGNMMRVPEDLRVGVHENIRIAFTEEVLPRSPIGIFPQLRSLVLIHTGCKWKTVFSVLPAFPVLESLVLCRNDMTDFQNIQLDETTLQYLKFLNLQDTNLSSFQGITKFKNLKALERLILNKNKLQRFGHIDGFKSLKSLSIENNLVAVPIAISELGRIDTVEYFNIRHNPIGNKLGNGYVRQRSVAEFPKLTVINGADLKKYERKDCEVFYLRETFYEYFNLRKVPDYDYDFDDFTNWAREWHPRIESLIKKYGNPFEVQKKEIVQIIKEEVRQLDTKKPGGMIELMIEFRAGLSKGRSEKKRLPVSWTLSNLKNLFSKTLKVPVNAQKLSFKAREDSSQQPLDEDHKTLSFYNLNSFSVVYFDMVL